MKSLIDRISLFLAPKSAHDYLETLNPQDNFLALSINKNLTHTESLKRVLQINGKNGVQQLLISRDKDSIQAEVLKDNRLIAFSKNIDDQAPYSDKVSEIFQYSIESAKDILRTPSEITSDPVSETRGLEWVKVSLVVLKSAIKDSIENPDLIFEGQLFCGKRSPEQPFQLRIQCLSLDFLLEFLDDHRLRVQAWDYKNLQPDSTQDPTFSGEFVQLKQPVFDEFIPLLVEMSRAATKFN